MSILTERGSLSNATKSLTISLKSVSVPVCMSLLYFAAFGQFLNMNLRMKYLFDVN